jgi:hypothetical protein
MTTTDYRQFPPIGQNDQTSCWAACLSWWLKANGRRPSTQNDLIVEFNSLASQDGSVTFATMIKIFATPRFNMQSVKFEIDGLQQIRDNEALPITIAPNIICYSKFLRGPGIIGQHANVVWNQREQGGHTIVTCMDPAFPEPGVNGQRTGRFVDTDINEFLRSSPILLACSN